MVSTQKITINIPLELKEQLNELKDEMQTTLSSIYVEAIKKYLRDQEVAKWTRGFELASEDKQYQNLCKEYGSAECGGVYEYEEI
ncbi:MAG: hypothetical protein WCR69_00720 [Sulfuricurvum sp.]